jgi:hypothetical protein
MATRTRGGVLVAGLVVVTGVVFAPKLVDQVGAAIGELFGANEPVVVGEGVASFMVAAGATPKVAACSTPEILQNKICGNVKFVIIDAAKMPFIARNIQLCLERRSRVRSTSRFGSTLSQLQEVLPERLHEEISPKWQL